MLSALAIASASAAQPAHVVVSGAARLKLNGVDLAVAFLYLLGIVAVGLFTAFRHRHKQGEAREYFLAGNSLRWGTIGLALFATNISTLHLVSLAQGGFDSGLLLGNFEWMAALTLIMLGFFFAPVYLRTGITTLPDFFEKRYNRSCRDWLAGVSVFTAVLIHIAFALLAGGIILETLLGIPMLWSLAVLCALTGLYTIVGGLLAVVVTESIQTVVLLCGALLITGFAFWQLGGTAEAPGGWNGWSHLKNILQRENAMEKLSMLRSHSDSSGMPWYSIFLGYPVLGIWYWCADQTIVQRVLAAKDIHHARQGAIFAGFLKILPVFLFVLPGLLAFALFRDGRLDLSSLPNTNGEIDSKGIYAAMIVELLPTGVRGVIVAALMAALMSTVSGALNSISTLVSYDFVKRLKPDLSDAKLVRTGRIAAGIALVGAVALVPILNRFGSVFEGMAEIISHIAPPITCVLLLGIFWSGASSRAATLTLIGGSLLGGAVFTFNKLVPDHPLNHMPGGFMMMAFWLFLACMALQITASIVLPDPPDARQKLVWNKPWTPLLLPSHSRFGNAQVWTAFLLGIMVSLYAIFR